MPDREKTKEELIAEVKVLRQRIAEMESRQRLEGRNYSWIEAEDLYLSLIAEALFGYYVIQDGQFHFVNPKMVEIFGYTVEEMLEKVAPLDVVHPYDRKLTGENITLRLEGFLGSATYNLRGLRKDGSTVFIQVTGSRIMYRGRPAVHGNVLDITERRNVERALRQSETRYRGIVEDQTELICRFLPDGTLTFVNEAFCRYYNRDRSQLVGHSLLKEAVEEERQAFFALVATLSHSKPVTTAEHKMVFPHGLTRWREWTMRAIFDEFARPVEFQGVGRDITEQKHAEQALVQSEKNLRQQVDYLNTLMQSLNELFYTYDRDGFITFMNRKSKKVLGYEPHELLGLNVIDFVPQNIRKAVNQGMQKILQQGQSLSDEIPVFRKDGSQRLVRSNAAPIIEEGLITGAMVLAEDISERKRAEEALAAEKEWLAVTLRSIGEGVITTDTKGTIMLINDVAEKLTGWKQAEVVGKPIEQIFKLIHQNTRQPKQWILIEKLQTRALVELENQILVCRDGQERIIDASGARIHDCSERFIGAVLVFRDITDRIRIENELIKASKLESLGVLAGGIAHDFNNLLTVIMGYITLAKISLDDSESALEMLAKSEKASWQAKALTQQLLTFARGGAPLKRTISIVNLIKDSVDFTLSGSNLKCELTVPDCLWPVDVDEGQLSQVINNLVINAWQAMPQGGTIRVTAENIMVDETLGLPLENGKYIKVKIQDEGIGIPEVNHQKIFDPYFTTKPTGSGLGLATAYSIIRNHDGFIGIDSIEGQGTAFDIYLPISREAPRDSSSIASNPAVGQGRILVMDDQKNVREVVGQMLKAIGYEATMANTGLEAVQLYQEALKNGQKYDVVIIDLTIPGGMGGRDAISKLLAADPEVKAIVSSGYSNDPIMAEYARWGFKGVVSKPFGISELSQVLKTVLG